MEKLLNKNLSRLEILKSNTDFPIQKEVKISVYRNHSFEHMEGMINKFLNQSALSANFSYSDYDDSFNFSPINSSCDLNLIWIDFERYKNIDINSWFLNRIEKLKQISSKPIFVYYIGAQNIELKVKDVVFKNALDIEKELCELFYDREKFEYSGTVLSSKASIKIAQELGLKYLPSFFLTPIKAIVVDMDNTFYKGIVAEDGIENIVPNLEFQKQLKTLKDKGVLLSIASKNEFEDVKQLFEKRKDFILNWDDFSSHNISWQTKEKAILNTAKQFNIGLDSILFIDDNIGEINFVKNHFPEAKTLIADEDLSFKLKLFPLLERYSTSKEDSLRASDIDANQKREELKTTLNEEEYFKSLEMKLNYSLDKPSDFERAIQLLNKTNQFIFSYKRYKKDEISSNQHILTISLKDKLSDSGIISIIVAHKENSSLFVDEVVVSCRALGRNIEDFMLNNAFKYLKNELKTNDELVFNFKIGDRNNPAKTWLEGYSGLKFEKDIIAKCTIKDIENKFIKMEYE